MDFIIEENIEEIETLELRTMLLCLKELCHKIIKIQTVKAVTK